MTYWGSHSPVVPPAPQSKEPATLRISRASILHSAPGSLQVYQKSAPFFLFLLPSHCFSDSGHMGLAPAEERCSVCFDSKHTVLKSQPSSSMEMDPLPTDRQAASVQLDVVK